MEVADKGTGSGEVVGIEGIRACRVCGDEVGWMGVGIVFGAKREAP